MDKVIWAGIVHNVLILKEFTFGHLKAVSGADGDQCREVLSELVAGDFLELDLGRKLYYLTSNLDKRFNLEKALKEVREIQGVIDAFDN